VLAGGLGLLLPLVLLACTAAPAPTSQPAAGSGSGPAPAAAAGPSTAEWDKLVAAARQEGVVVLGAAPNPVLRTTLPARFKERFGVEVEYLGGSTAGLAARLESERAAGLYTVDVVAGGPDTFATVMYPQGMFDPIAPTLLIPDVADSSKWVKGKPWYFDPEERAIPRLINQVSWNFSVNADVVNPDEIRSPQDLLDPKWRGKIATTAPVGAGTGSNVAGRVLYVMGEDYLRNLYLGQAVAVAGDDRQIADWIGRGTHPIAIALSATERAHLRDQGFNVKTVKMNNHEMAADTSTGQFLLGLMNQAPHPNAAKLLANWMLTQEAMQLIADAEAKPVTRTDVDYAKLEPDVIAQPGVNFFDTAAWDWVVNERRAAQQRVRDILGR
jgi:iron(III) transport system substrate-binding protein